MTEFALVSPIDAIDRYASNVDPTVQTKTGWRWLPVEVTSPTHDPVTQVKEGPTVTVLVDKVTRIWTVRSKTAQEIDDEKTARAASLDDVLFRIAFNHENRLRTLAGQSTITAVQFRAAIKALL